MPSTSLAFPSTDPALAATFTSLWHNWHGSGDGWVNVFSLPSQRSIFVPVADLANVIIDNGLDELTYVGGGRGPQNLYHSVGVYGHKPAKGRGRASDIAWSPGVWLDCDVKPGSFASGDQIMDLVWDLDRRGIGPHLVVKTGPAGGHHLYWRTTEVLDGPSVEEAGLRIWLYVSAVVGADVSIDRLVEPNRVMRLPGSLWWPKPGASGVGGEGGDGVLLRRADNTGSITRETLYEATEDLWREWTHAREQVRARARAGAAEVSLAWREDLLELVNNGGVGAGRWGTLARMATWEDEFNASVTWAQVLEPAGWVRTSGPDDAGRVSWMRPGTGRRNPRSLVTDWEESPHVAKLMSDAPETGLLHLEKAGVPLTKLTVMAALYFNDNTSETLIRWRKAVGE